MIKAPSHYVFYLGLLAALLVTWLVYAPGLAGSFQFDDFANLPALGASGPVNDWATFWRYITSGVADPTGRPLALLSFLLDAHDWPADPRPFLRTNLALHLINGALLALLLRRLGRTLFSPLPAGEGAPQGWVRVRSRNDATHSAGPSPKPFSPARGLPQGRRRDQRWRIDLSAVLGAALWLLHPLLVSTTLYIVQREAMLPATFTLLGLLLWLRGRDAMRRGARLRGAVWIVLGLGGCTLLGVLSKANGILLPALALILEYVFLRACHPHTSRNVFSTGERTYRRLMLPMAWLPTALVAAYLLQQGWHGLTHGIAAVRPWTLGQRLLTEPRVLMDYLGLLWIPRPFTPGLFNDHIFASTSLLSPASTLLALLALIGLAAGAWLLRKRWPALALAILFYLVGQSLESSTLALELYFEHRNYLPALLMFWPLALWLCGVRWSRAQTHPLRSTNNGSNDVDHASAIAASLATTTTATRATPPTENRIPWSRAKLALAIVLLTGLGAMTHARASLWGNTHDQSLLWAQLNPDSPRAQANAALTDMRTGHPARAVVRLQPLLAAEPDQAQLALNLFTAQCAMGDVDDATLQATQTALRTTRNPGTLLVRWFGPLIAHSAHPTCPQADLSTLQQLLDNARHNPLLLAVPGRVQEMDNLHGRIALLHDHPDVALADFNHALDQNVRASTALQQAALLGSRGYPQRGLAHLDHYHVAAAVPEMNHRFNMARIHAWVLQHQRYWQKELTRLRATLRADATHQATGHE